MQCNATQYNALRESIRILDARDGASVRKGVACAKKHTHMRTFTNTYTQICENEKETNCRGDSGSKIFKFYNPLEKQIDFLQGK